MANKKVTAVTVGTDDIYFIIEDKEISVLKLMSNLDNKINKVSLSAWVALGLTGVLVIPVSIFQLALIEIKEQTQTIEKQSQTIQSLSDRLIVIETELKK